MKAAYCSSVRPTQLHEDNQDVPKVLVLLAAYNGEQWILEQVRSILSQEKVQVHLVIRDDASTDKTGSIITELTAGHITVTSALKSSGSASQNFFDLICGNAADSFDFVAFSDQDDIWNQNKLHRACAMLKCKGAAGYSSAVTAIWNDGSTRPLRPATRQTRTDFLFEGAGQGCTYVLTVDFYRRVRDFVSHHRAQMLRVYFHDWAIYALARTWGLPWVFDFKSTMYYRQHKENVFGARKGSKAIAQRFSLIRNGWYRTQLGAIAELCSTAAPQNFRFAEWRRLCAQSDSLNRRLELTRFCFSGGRRRKIDQTILLLSAIAGWI